ncbi:zinc-ribbon-domain-containing protein [Zychaea mexicana]|uniref:zinc-ribbon-domain-containing protein n=1 Tax=Zychaea mexicana TaxID=64656 RepID=UPI0022FEA24D|nr:zinc-ribbon-domain-containing protein [Zychaea mexicana]KAI9495454.1 zinc-ribbon-domain-containing protein [Zychaea mexicana]
MGCKHYQRKVKLEANCCKRIFPCRFCHDDASDHNIIRHETKNMLCMMCMTLQPAAKMCSKCNVEAAAYYCDKCKLWDDDPKKSIYHCDDCGICRQGRGLDDDYFHCHKCNICMVMAMKGKHRCIERNLESDCPICGEYMFTSTTTVVFMQCGHCIHKLCYSAYIQTSYQCPTCLKSLGDMSEYFARLDRELVRQPMPPEYEKYVSHIFCNDCEKKSTSKYHFFYHKCTHCGSYNTTVLKTENTENTEEAAQDDESKNPPPSSSSTYPAQSSTSDPASASNGSTNALDQSTNSDNDQQMIRSHGSGTATNGAVPAAASALRNGGGTSSSSPSSSSNPPAPRPSASLHDPHYGTRENS